MQQGLEFSGLECRGRSWYISHTQFALSWFCFFSWNITNLHMDVTTTTHRYYYYHYYYLQWTCCRFGVFWDICEGQREREGSVWTIGGHNLRQDVREFRRGAVVDRCKQFSDTATHCQYQQQPELVMRVLMWQDVCVWCFIYLWRSSLLLLASAAALHFCRCLSWSPIIT